MRRQELAARVGHPGGVEPGKRPTEDRNRRQWSAARRSPFGGAVRIERAAGYGAFAALHPSFRRGGNELKVAGERESRDGEAWLRGLSEM